MTARPGLASIGSESSPLEQAVSDAAKSPMAAKWSGRRIRLVTLASEAAPHNESASFAALHPIVTHSHTNRPPLSAWARLLVPCTHGEPPIAERGAIALHARGVGAPRAFASARASDAEKRCENLMDRADAGLAVGRARTP